MMLETTLAEPIVWSPRRWSREFYSAIDWNPQQLEIFDEVQSGTDNILIRAGAGSGKSTVLKAIIGLLPAETKINVLAYNTSVKEAFANDPRIPKRVKVSTAHSFGHSMLMGHFRGSEVIVEENKAAKLAKWGQKRLESASSDYSYRLAQREQTSSYPVAPPILPEDLEKKDIALSRWREELEKLLNFARLHLTEPTVEDMEFTAGYFGVRFPFGKRGLAWGIKIALDLLESGFQQAVHDRIVDYPDMVWLPYRLKLYPFPTKKKAVLLVDEAQDANRAFLSIYKKFQFQGYRCIFVGDSHQSISGYMGALPTAMDTIERSFDCKVMPLAETQRCPKVHVALASLIDTSLRARTDAKQGRIALLRPEEVVKSVRPGDLVLCRFVAPLVKLNLEAKFFHGKTGVVRSRNIANEMSGFAKTISKHAEWSQFQAKLFEQRDFLVTKYTEADQLQMADAAADRYDCLNYCYEFLGKKLRSLEAFLQAIASAFPQEEESRDKHIIFSSIHSAKGDEADRVIIVGANLLPYRRNDMLKWQIQQEVYLTHVALTRSRDVMLLSPLARQEEVDDLMNLPLAGLKLEGLEEVEEISDLIDS